MKKRLALVWAPVVVCLAMMLPSSTLAATGYTFTVVEQHCITGGYGHNPSFRVRLIADGSTPASKLTIKSTSQYLSGGTWHNFYKWKTNKSTFTPNGQAHSIDYAYSHTNNSDTRKWRISSTLKAWQGTNVLSSKTLMSKAC